MKIFTIILAIAFTGTLAAAQTNIEKLAEAERSFAALAASKGTRTAFLENMSDDAILFLPDRVGGKSYWLGRGEEDGTLSWAPNYADVSSNGLIGYTTGNWEYRTGGQNSTPSASGEFVTVWQRGGDGRYRLNVDIGVSHENPEKFSTELTAPAYPSSPNDRNTSAADTANSFFELVGQSGLSAGYKVYAAKYVRSFREGRPPMIGKERLISFIRKADASTSLRKRTVFFGSADIAYVTNSYTRVNSDKSVETGNFLQIWKLIDGRWQIVVDIFKPVPAKS